MSLQRFIDTKAKAAVVFLSAVAALGGLILSTLAATAIFREWHGLAAGIVLMLAAIPFHCVGKKHPWGYAVSYLLNTVANGLSLSALYLTQGTETDLYRMLPAALPAAGILLLVYGMLQIFHKTKPVTVAVACVLNGLLTVAFAVLWILYGDLLFSFGFFCSLIALFYLGVFGVTVNHDERAVLRDISFGSFGSFIILTVVVAVVLSEGDILDGLDVPFDGSRTKKHKPKH